MREASESGMISPENHPTPDLTDFNRASNATSSLRIRHDARIGRHPSSPPPLTQCRGVKRILSRSLSLSLPLPSLKLTFRNSHQRHNQGRHVCVDASLVTVPTIPLTVSHNRRHNLLFLLCCFWHGGFLFFPTLRPAQCRSSSPGESGAVRSANPCLAVPPHTHPPSIHPQ